MSKWLLMNFKSKVFVSFYVFVSSLIVFLKQFLIAKYLIPADYGIYSKYYIVSTFTLSFGSLGLYYGTIYSISKNLEDKLFSLEKAKINLLWGYIYFTPILILILFFIFEFRNFYEYILLIFFSFSQVLFTISYLELNLINSLEFSKKLFQKNIFTLIPVLILTYLFNDLYYAIVCEAVLIIIQLIYFKQFNYKLHLLKFTKIFYLYIETKTYLGTVLTASLLFFLVRIVASNKLPTDDLGVYFLGFSLVIIGNQFQYLFSVILNPIFSKKSRNKEFSLYNVTYTWIITFIISIILYYTLYNIKDLVFDFFPKYKQIEVIYLPFCCLGLAKMSEIISIYFVLDGKSRFMLYSNLFSIFLIIIYCFSFWENLNSLQSFSNLIYFESFLLLVCPLIIFYFSNIKLKK
jgi:O-antigen/teichoic acid export membrane protein